MFEGAARAARLEHDRGMRVAWTIAALPRMKRFPALASLMLARERPARAKDWRDMLRAAEAWAGNR